MQACLKDYSSITQREALISICSARNGIVSRLINPDISSQRVSTIEHAFSFAEQLILGINE